MVNWLPLFWDHAHPIIDAYGRIGKLSLVQERSVMCWAGTLLLILTVKHPAISKELVISWTGKG